MVSPIYILDLQFPQKDSKRAIVFLPKFKILRSLKSFITSFHLFALNYINGTDTVHNRRFLFFIQFLNNKQNFRKYKFKMKMFLIVEISSCRSKNSKTIIENSTLLFRLLIRTSENHFY